MDSLTRKRKASQSTPVQHPHLLPPEDTDVLHEQPPPPPPTRKTKRPRLSISSPPPRKRSPPRPARPSPPSQAPWAHYRLHLQRRASLPHTLLSPLAESPLTPLQLACPQQLSIPQPLPTVTRETLRELDLEAILRNPQLRHDLLFDPGLQFRPTAGRRKQLAADHYWEAIAHELERGCTCAVWDVTGAMVECGCATTSPPGTTQTDTPWSDLPEKTKRTRPPTPPPWSERYTAYLEAATDPRLDEAHPHASEDSKDSEEEQVPFHIRVPSRVGPMLHELFAVLKCVIVPPPPPTPHTSTRPPLPPPSSEAQALLAHLDSSLMEQELRRGIFDPAGLFGLIGETLKRHCAPMRDRLVDDMVNVARSTDETITRRAVKTIRMCFEILELMKLDIANHQLQHLRPFLASSTPDFELRVFVERCRRGLDSPRVAREWLQRAWTHTRAMPVPAGILADKNTATSPSGMDVDGPTPTIPRACALPRRTLVQLSLINAVTELVFNPPSHPPCTASSSPDSSYPETLYLDTARVALLAADAADLTALYMLLMLWRQLVYWKPAGGEAGAAESEEVFPRYARAASRLEDWEVDRVKREIWEVGPRRIGSCFSFTETTEGGRADASAEDRCKWIHAMQNVALQIAMRAEEARTRTLSESSEPESAATRRPPSQEALGLMSGWIHSHMRRDSALAGRLRELLRQEVADAVTRLTFAAGGDVGGGSISPAPGPRSSGPESGGGTAGLEPLMPEIRHLAQRLAKLVLVNLRVYWSLYEVEGFLVDEADEEAS